MEAADTTTPPTSATPAGHFSRPLNYRWKKEHLNVKESYLQYFSNPSFIKGWAKPLLTINDVEEAFDLAAEIVVRVRRELDAAGASHKQRAHRLTSGGAKEFLHQVESKPQENLDAFVRDLVRSTFRDTNGYVEGLTEEKLDKYIDEVKAHRAQELAASGSTPGVTGKLKTLSTSICAKLHGLTERSLSNEKARDHLLNLHRLLKMLQSVDVELDIIGQGDDHEHHETPPVAEEKTTDKSAFAPLAELKSADATAVADQPMEVAAEKTEPVPTMDMKDQSFEEARAEATPHVAAESAKHLSAEPAQQGGGASTAPLQGVVSSPDVTSGSDTEAKVLPHIVQDEKHMLKIKQVAEEFDGLRHQSLDLAAEAEKLQLEQFFDDTEAGIRKLDGMQKRCVTLAHNLMQELLALDELVGMNASARPVRKAQVERIQETLDAVESLQKRISGMIKQVREEEAKTKRVPKLKDMAKQVADEQTIRKVEEERKRREKAVAEERTAADSKAKRRRSEAAAAEAGAEDTEAEEKIKKSKAHPAGRWKQLRLRPEFESKEHGDAYSISSYIPGMRQEDIELNLGANGSTLEIRGCRYPSPQDEAALKRQLQQLRLRETHGYSYPSQESDETALLRLGSGRFGTFSQSYNLPRGVETSKISASYEGGVLRVVIPKVPQPRRHRAQPAFADPYAAHYGRRSGMPAFTDADDAWW